MKSLFNRISYSFQSRAYRNINLSSNNKFYVFINVNLGKRSPINYHPTIKAITLI